MASSNRHWPSMFKSKPHHGHHQWQHDINSSLLSSACNRTPYSNGIGSTIVGACEERSPEPKPRWNPRPEQIRILEAIFNSGMVNPPRDEIRKIRAQLQEYGQVGDANVFYWFQNRKSRSKHKLRHLQTSKITPPTTTTTAPCSSSSSSSEKSSVSLKSSTNLTNSPTGSVNQTYFQTPTIHHHEPYFLNPIIDQVHNGFLFSELSNVVDHRHHDHNSTSVGPCTSLLLGEMLGVNNNINGNGGAKKDHDDQDKSTVVGNYSSTSQNLHHLSTALAATVAPTVEGAALRNGSAAARSMVFINDVAFEVDTGPLNVREAFGADAMLIHSSGQPVLTNEWGFTLTSLQHGASYYLVTFS